MEDMPFTVYICLSEDETNYCFHVTQTPSLAFAKMVIQLEMDDNESILFLKEPKDLTDQEIETLIEATEVETLFIMTTEEVFDSALRERIRSIRDRER